MDKIYPIRIKETLIRVEPIRASSPIEALKEAKNLYKIGNITLDASDFAEVEIEYLPEKEEDNERG